MGQRRIVTIPFPMKGENRRWAYGQQSPDSSFRLLNVRPDESDELRTRGGTRPGLIRAYPTQVGADEVRLLSQVRAVPTQGAGFWSTSFDEFQSGGLFQNPLWSLPIGGDNEPQYVGGQLVRDELDGLGSSAVRVVIPDLDLTQAYQIRSQTVPFSSPAAPPGEYFLYVGLDNAAPDITQDALYCRLNWAADEEISEAEVKNIIAGVVVDVDNIIILGLAQNSSHDLVFDIDPVGGTATFKINGTQVAQLTGVSFPLAGGGRLGFRLNSNIIDNKIAAYSWLAVSFQSSSTAQANRNYLVSGSNGGLKRENAEGDDLEAAAAASAADIVVTPPAPQQTIQAVDYLGKLYIADHDEPSTQDIDGEIDAAGTAFTSPLNTTMGDDADKDNDLLVVTGTTNAGTYLISAASGTTLTLITAMATKPATGMTFRVERAPKVYDPILDTLSIYYNSAAGFSVANQPPTGAIVIGTFMDRIVLAGGKNNPQVWFMSARGDPLDWDFSLTNEGAAVAGDDSNAGQIGAPITAMTPSVDDYLIFASLGSLWLLRGDPTVGGRMDNLSRRIGIVGTEAWTYGPDSSIFFLSRDGLYTIAPGATSYPQSVSVEVLPDALKEINNATTHVTLEYDVLRRGIHIHLTNIDTGNSLHYWFDLELPGFWPFQFGDVNHAPFTTLQYEADKATAAAVLLGGRDGYLRRYNRFSGVDDGTDEEPIVSYAILGPIPLGSVPGGEGMIQRLEIILGRNSNVLTWKIYVANTAEDAIRKMNEGLHQKTGTTRVSPAGTDVHSLLSVHHPRVRDYYAVIRIENTDNLRWSFEQMVAIIKDVGRHRTKTV